MLCLDVETLPETPPANEAAPVPGRLGQEGWTWRAGLTPGLVVVCQGHRPEAELELARITLEESVQEVRRAGFTVRAACDAATGDETERPIS